MIYQTHVIDSNLSYIKADKETIMKSNLWGFFILLSIVCLFSTRNVTDAQELTPLTTSEQVPLTAESETAKQVYTQLMHAIYLQSFDRGVDAAKRIYAAKHIYDNLVKLAPDSAYIWYKRGQLRFDPMEDIKGAEEDMAEALRLNPSHVSANWQLAEILFYRALHSGGKYIIEGLEATKKVAELDPDHFDAHLRIVRLAFRLQEYSTAETSLKALTRILPFEPEFHRQLGDLYQITNKPQAAIDAYQRVIKIRPKDVHSNLGIGLVFQELAQRALTQGKKDPQSEEVDLSTLIRDAETYLERAIFLSKDAINNPANESRRAYFQRLLVDSQYALANVYFLFEKFEKAEETFAELLADNPGHIGATYGIAAVYQAMEVFEKAEEYLRKTLQIEPAHEYALNALGYLYAEQGTNLDEAEALIKRALRRSPTNGAYLDSLGWVFFKQGRFAEAVTTLENANQQMPENIEILMHLGDAYLKNGEPEKARRVWEQAQTIEPDNDEIKTRLKQ